MTTLLEHWKDLGRAGQLGVGLASRFGGQGGGPEEVWRTASRVGHTGFDLGVGLTWIVHHIVARFQLGRFGTEEQKAAWLPRLASGESMAAATNDGPNTQENPLELQVLADGSYRINGFLTDVINAPIADLLVLFAPLASGADPIGAFLVHRDTSGLKFEPAADRGYCPTSPLANAVFDDCVLPAGSLLGTPEQAREMLNRRGRQFDLLRLQVICGFLVRLADEVKPHLRRSDRARISLLVMQGRLQALQSLNAHVASRWDEQESVDLVAAEAAARELIRFTREDLAELPDHPAVAAAQRDLELVRLGWRRTRQRFLLAARQEEQESTGDPPG